MVAGKLLGHCGGRGVLERAGPPGQPEILKAVLGEDQELRGIVAGIVGLKGADLAGEDLAALLRSPELDAELLAEVQDVPAQVEVAGAPVAETEVVEPSLAPAQTDDGLLHGQRQQVLRQGVVSLAGEADRRCGDVDGRDHGQSATLRSSLPAMSRRRRTTASWRMRGEGGGALPCAGGACVEGCSTTSISLMTTGIQIS